MTGANADERVGFPKKRRGNKLTQYASFGLTTTQTCYLARNQLKGVLMEHLKMAT